MFKKIHPTNQMVFWLALILTFSPPSSLRFDAIAPKPKAKADRRRNSHGASCVLQMTFCMFRRLDFLIHISGF